LKTHAFHLEANEEYAEAAQFYFRIDPELAGRFYDEIERLVGDIRKYPDRFRLSIRLFGGTSPSYFPTRSCTWISQIAF